MTPVSDSVIERPASVSFKSVRPNDGSLDKTGLNPLVVFKITRFYEKLSTHHKTVVSHHCVQSFDGI